MRIGILTAGHAPDELLPDLGDYPDMFVNLLGGNGFTFQSWAVVDGDMPEDIHAADGWLITGSRHGAYDDLPWIPRLEDFIREIYADGRPLVGICFGHQIIAKALGGKVEKFEGGWSVGRQLYDFEGEEMALHAWHQDQVVERPEGARVIGSSDFCENAALIYDNRILTIQPHPEYSSDVLDGLIRYRGHVVPAERVDTALKTLGAPVRNADIARRIAGFLLDSRRG
ncbi:type 1 glutamine amidotransferase [Tropicimonas sp. IMCC6043]|uniref:type 1 glutamine amidotransferase n=1 Tax=Tropicimonas sp. IMCC6043 TaxID=2510645 RepID=UPI00101D9B49|nr:type 1 glutamine amidotransferase [Tropicimonas sp. IMCC6043]RYH08910.1 type 1 glutamine amidotransferase [Tropicimonas sp. IMCC6043]